MATSIQSVFSTAAAYQERAEPLDLIARVRSGSELTVSECERFMDWLVYELRTVLKENETKVGSTDVDVATHSFAKRCGFSQDVATLALGDRGIGINKGDTQFLAGYVAGHAFATIELKSVDGPIPYLLDPTFRQFCLEDVPQIDDCPAPGHWLAGDGEEPEFVAGLLQNGYAQLDGALAKKYTASMCGGYAPFEDEGRALEFMLSPPQPEFDTRAINYYPQVRSSGFVF